MKIDVIQIVNEEKNEFEIKYDDQLKYKAQLPFVSIKEPFDIEKIRKIKIFDLDDNEIYTTDYKYIENLKEEFIPFKFVVTGSQKFNQLLFCSNENKIKIYYEENDLWDNRYVIEMNDKRFFCYSVEDGYIRHFPIYNENVQIGEALKSNVVIDGKDEYCCYLKKDYEYLSDGIVSLLLYLDRSEYNSSYLIRKSYVLEKKFSYKKTNKYYDKNWVKNHFNNEYFEKVNQNVILVKEKMKHPLQTSKEHWDSLEKKEKNLMKFILSCVWIILVVVGIIIVLCLFLVRK